MLTDEELANLKGYPHGSCGMLRQCLGNGFGICSKPGPPPFFHAVIRNPDFHFAKTDAHCRWLSASEMLIVNGFPAIPRLANPRGSQFRACSFATPAGSVFRDTRGQRSRQHMVAQSGNALNVCIAGALEIIMLLGCRRIDETPLARNSLRLMAL